MKRNVLAAISIFLATCTGVIADDWPQWRGPNRDGKSAETGFVKKWPENGPRQVWQVDDLGSGYSTPSVVGSRLYVLSNEGLENESVQAREVLDGKQTWIVRLGKVGEPNQQPAYPAARSTPTVLEGVVYAIGSDGDLVALKAEDGKEIWRKNLRTDFGGQPGRWAYSESPLIDNNKLICTPGGKDAALVALNKKTGEVIWKTEVEKADPSAYSSIIVVEAAGVKQYVQYLQSGLVGVDASTGKLLWHYDKPAKGSAANIPTPIVRGDLIFCSTGQGGAGLIQLVKNGSGIKIEEKYFLKKLPNAIGGSVLVGDFLYGTTSTGLECVEFRTGDIKWQDRSIGAGSVCFADGQLYLHGENGDVALVEATPAGYKENGRFTPESAPVDRKGKAWAYPIIANNRLYIRDAGHLWSYDIKAQ